MPDRKRDRTGGRPEFEVAYYTKELGKPLQRQMLQRQLASLSENGSITSSHGDDSSPQSDPPPFHDDRAG